MRRVGRILLLCILIVSLPVQGVVGVLAWPCTMNHSSRANPEAMEMDGCDEPEMSVAALPPDTLNAVGHVASHSGGPCEKCSHTKHSSCRACSACTAGAAAPPPVAAVASLAARVTGFPTPRTSSFTGWIPARIERPPRP